MSRAGWCYTCQRHQGPLVASHVTLTAKVEPAPLNVFLVDDRYLVHHYDPIDGVLRTRELGPDDFPTIKPLFDVGGGDGHVPAFVRDVMRDAWFLDECCIEWYRSQRTRAMATNLGTDFIINLVSAAGTGKGTLSDLNKRVFGGLYTDLSAAAWDKFSTSRIAGRAVLRVDESDDPPTALIKEIRKIMDATFQVRPMHNAGYEATFRGSVEMTSTQPLPMLDADAGDERRFRLLITRANPNIDTDPAFKERMTSDLEARRWYSWVF